MKIRKTLFRWMCVLAIVCATSILFQTIAAAEDKKEILIGAPNPMSGIMAMDGVEIKWGYEQAVQDVNKKGGIFIKEYGKKLPVRLVFADDGSDPSKTVEAMERLIKRDNVDLLLSTIGTKLNIGAVTIAEKYNILYQLTTCFPGPLKDRNLKWVPHMNFTAAGLASIPYKILNSIPKNERPKRPALLMMDSIDGETLGKRFRQAANSQGVKFVVDEPWAIGARDYTGQILKMKAKNIDALIFFGVPTDSITLIRQMKQHKLNVKYLHGIKGTWAAGFYQALGEDSNYVLSDGFWSEDFPYPGAKELGKKYYEKFGVHSVATGLYYANAQILLMAIERAGSFESQKVRDAIFGSEFKGTVMGDITYNNKGFALIDMTAHQWWEGKQEWVYPITGESWKLKLMPPWDER